MLLSDRDIWAAIEKGDIAFVPELSYEQVGPASIDLRLDKLAKRLRLPPPGLDTIRLSTMSAKALIDFAAEPVNLDDKPFYLEPGESLIGFTLEEITLSPRLGARVEGRSGFARVGLSVHNTAPTIQPGWKGQIALEFTNHGHYKLHLESGILICQLLLERLTSEPSSGGYTGSFQQQRST
jgi:dCTP deaminase